MQFEISNSSEGKIGGMEGGKRGREHVRRVWNYVVVNSK